MRFPCVTVVYIKKNTQFIHGLADLEDNNKKKKNVISCGLQNRRQSNYEIIFILK